MPRIRECFANKTSLHVFQALILHPNKSRRYGLSSLSAIVLSPAARATSRQVIPGYADTHTPAKLEVPVKLAYSQQAEVEGRAQAVMSRL